MTALDAMQRHLDALYETDARGRILARRDAPAETAPRFHFARTALGNLWRFRVDVDTETLKRLAMLAAKEAPLHAPGAANELPAPERAEFMRRALEEAAPVDASRPIAVFGFAAMTSDADERDAVLRSAIESGTASVLGAPGGERFLQVEGSDVATLEAAARFGLGFVGDARSWY